MKKLLLGTLLLFSLTSYSQDLKAGDYLIKAQKQHTAAVVSYMLGTLIGILPVVAGMDKDQGMLIGVLGGTTMLVGFGFNISAWGQIKKAGIKLNSF